MDSSAEEAVPRNGGAGRSDRARVPAKASARKEASERTILSAFPFLGGEQGVRQEASQNWRWVSGFGSHVALALCLFGFAWAASSYFSGGRSPLDALGRLFPASAPSPQELAERAERAELARAMQKMAADLHGVEASVEALRTAQQAQNAKGSAALDGLSSRLEAAKTATNAAIVSLAEKVDHLPREPDVKLAQVIERLDRLEHDLAKPAATAPVAEAPSKSQLVAGEGPGKPRLITNWVVRDVYDGAALLEGKHGTLEVVPGETIPGAGRVKSIERRGSGWIVITSEGIVDSIRDRF